MEKPKISDKFTVEDIHKIREYNHDITKTMTFDERKSYYEKGANKFKAKLKKQKELLKQ